MAASDDCFCVLARRPPHDRVGDNSIAGSDIILADSEAGRAVNRIADFAYPAPPPVPGLWAPVR
jgi:hypothetical protein